MGKAKAKGQKSEFDEMMDEALGEAESMDVDLDAGPAATKAEAAKEEPKAEEPKEPQPEQNAEAASEDREETSEPAAEDPAAKERALREAAERANQALIRELVEMRARARGRANAERANQAPNPAQQPVQQPATEPPKPLRGEDLIQFRDGQIGLDVDRIREMVRSEARQATMPDPEVVRQQRTASEYNQLKDEFIRENPAINSHAMQHVEQAYEFMTLAAASKAQEWGVALDHMNFDGRMDFLNASGVMGEVARRFPHLAPEMPELLRADALESREWMRSILRRYSQQLAGVLGGGEQPRESAPTPPQKPVYQPPLNSPPNLAKVGTSTPEPARADRERWAELEKLEAADPVFGMTKGEIAELERLRSKFDRSDMPWGVGAGRS